MVKVLFIAGSGRTGSTILHNVLGQIDGFTAVGELRYIWGRSVLKNQSCGCGTPFRECRFWDDVMTNAFGGRNHARARDMLDFTESFRIHNLPMVWVPPLRSRELTRLTPYLEHLGRLYSAIQEVSGCRVIVDSSKNPSYGYLLGQVDAVEPYYLHFIRDPRATAYSWGRRQDFEPGVPMARKSASASAVQWLARNLTAELFLAGAPGRWLQLRYEDFITRPRDHVTAIVRWTGESAFVLPFTSQHDVHLDRGNHSVFGNRTRFRTGPVTLRRDDRWRTAMRHRDRWNVAALTWPLRLRYGYIGRNAALADPPPDGRSGDLPRHREGLGGSRG
jgi:sulfotransferase family protein